MQICFNAGLSRLWKERLHNHGRLHRLGSSANELETLAKSTEGDFLAIGAKLQDFYHRAEEISKISASVVTLLSGKEIDSVIGGFREVMDRIRQLEDESRRSVEALRHLTEVLSTLERNLSGFDKIVRSLRVLCVTTRIESAGLGGREGGFNVLADEVSKLALEIEEKYPHLLARTESLNNLIGETLLKVSALEVRQRAQAGIIIDKTMASLESLTEKHASSSRGATGIAERYDAVSRSIGEIVTSMQFHDITRQRIEHAKEALEGICHGERATDEPRKAEEGGQQRPGAEWARNMKERSISVWNGKGNRSESPGERLRMAHGICQLQIAQLRNARDAMLGAVENIIMNLRGVADFVTRMSRETQTLAGTADETGHSYLSEIETGFSAVGSAFSAYTGLDRELSSTMGSVGTSLGNMLAFAADIEGIGQRIKLIALNSIVKAAHIGEEGRTLGVLAESIHQLSVETCLTTGTVSGSLRSMTSEAESLCAVNTADDGKKGGEVDRVQEVLTTLLTDLQNVSQRTVALLARMKNEGCDLSEDILRTAESIEVHHRVDSVLSGVVSQLEEIVTSCRPSFSVDGQSDTAEQYQALAASYTMQEERAVHHSLLSGEAASEKPSSDSLSLAAAASITGIGAGVGAGDHDKESEEQSGEDLGDNVELF